MPLLYVNMPCPLLFWLVIVLFHCRASSPAQYTLANPVVPPPTHAMTSPGLKDVSRDHISHHSMPRPTSTVFTSYHTFVCTLCLESILSCPETCSFYSLFRRTRRPVLIAFSHTLILLLLCSSGDVEVNQGPAVPNSTPIPRVLSFVDFCNRISLAFMHVNIRSLLPNFVLFTALAHSDNPDVRAVSESWLRNTSKNPEISIPNYNIFRQDRTAKGAVLQSTAERACRVLSHYPDLYPNDLTFYY